MKNLLASPGIRATFRLCMRKHAKLLYTVPVLMLIIITIEITNYWSGKCLICSTGSDTHAMQTGITIVTSKNRDIDIYLISQYITKTVVLLSLIANTVVLL